MISAARGACRVLPLLIFLLVSLNLGGALSLALQVGRGEGWAALGTLALLIFLDLLGFWSLRHLRGRGGAE